MGVKHMLRPPAFACLAMAVLAFVAAAPGNAAWAPAGGAQVLPALGVSQYLPDLKDAPGAQPDWNREALYTLCEAEQAYQSAAERARLAEARLALTWEQLRQAEKARDVPLAGILRREVTASRLNMDEAIAAREAARRVRDDARTAFDQLVLFDPDA